MSEKTYTKKEVCGIVNMALATMGGCIVDDDNKFEDAVDELYDAWKKLRGIDK